MSYRMAIHLASHNLTYFPVPKAACTSLKNVMYQLKFGVPFPNAHPGLRNTRSIHRLHEGFVEEDPRERWSGTVNFCFVREPIARLLSAYTNRVLTHRQLSPERIADKRRTKHLKADPTLDEFLDNFAEYREHFRGIRLHTDPFVQFIGDDPKFYARIFQPKTMKDFESWMSGDHGLKVTVPHLKRTDPNIKAGELSPRHRAMLDDFYRQDYRFLEAAKIVL
jgi:hypothetical protein